MNWLGNSKPNFPAQFSRILYAQFYASPGAAPVLFASSVSDRLGIDPQLSRSRLPIPARNPRRSSAFPPALPTCCLDSRLGQTSCCRRRLPLSFALREAPELLVVTLCCRRWCVRFSTRYNASRDRGGGPLGRRPNDDHCSRGRSG